MIAKAETISHGGISINYITRLGMAEMVKLNHLPSDIEVQAFWAHMKAHQLLHLDKRDKGHPVKNDMIRIEISPERDDSNNWTISEWRELLEQFVRAFDSAGTDENDRRFRNHKCRLANSQYLATLHRDSGSGILHMHLDCNRIDMNGDLNDDYLIGERAAYAANKVTHERGWVQAEQRAAENRAKISKDCIAVLKEMPRFVWDEYVTQLKAKGYDLRLHRDSEGNVRGYSVRMGHSIYKSSVLGHSRNLLPSKIENTWASLHPLPSKVIARQEPVIKQEPAKVESDIIDVTVNVGSSVRNITISKAAFSEMTSNVMILEPNPRTETFANTGKTAILLFANCINEATSIAENCGGGGSSPSSDWGRDKDDDELEWMRRCVRMAHEMVTTPKRTYRR